MVGIDDLAISHLWEFIAGALSLNKDVFQQVERVPWGERVALYTILLAGCSEAIAQGIVLFLNRVKPLRFVLSLAIAAVLFVGSFFFWAGSTWVASVLLVREGVTFMALAKVLGLSFAPKVFSFFVALPYLGLPISFVLSIWSLLSFLIGLQVLLGVGIWGAFWCGILGWIVLQILQRTIGRPFAALGRWIKDLAAGVPLITNLRDLERLVDRGRRR